MITKPIRPVAGGRGRHRPRGCRFRGHPLHHGGADRRVYLQPEQDRGDDGHLRHHGRVGVLLAVDAGTDLPSEIIRMSLTRREIHHLVDALPERELTVAKRYLQFLQGVENDSLNAALMTAPWDDEPESPEEIEAIHEAYQDVERGAIVDDEQLDSLLQQ